MSAAFWWRIFADVDIAEPIREYTIPASQVKQEIVRFRQSLSAVRDHLHTLARQLRASAGGAEEIIHTHLHMLDDAVIADDTEARISEQKCNAEWALQLQLDGIITEFKHLDDEYIRSMSFRTDLRILCKTVNVVFARTGH